MNLSNLESADVDMKVINEGDFQSCLIQSNLMKDETAVLLAYLYYCIERQCFTYSAIDCNLRIDSELFPKEKTKKFIEKLGDSKYLESQFENQTRILKLFDKLKRAKESIEIIKKLRETLEEHFISNNKKLKFLVTKYILKAETLPYVNDVIKNIFLYYRQTYDFYEKSFGESPPEIFGNYKLKKPDILSKYLKDL